MACSVHIDSVNGVVPPGTTAPSQIRVTGRLLQCGGDNVVVTTSVTTGSVTTTADGNGHFLAVLPLSAAAGVTCGQQVSVTATCASNSTCQTAWSGALVCCEITKVTAFGVVLPAAVMVSQIRVNGIARGCYGDQVDVGSNFSPTTLSVPVDPVTGAFSALLTVTGTPPNCDDMVHITVQCTQAAACSATIDTRLDCGGCARAAVSYTTTCVGTPPQPVVALDATIYVAKGATVYMRWLYGDGQAGTVFVVDNTTGTATKPHPHSESHPYAPSSTPYPATLIVTNAAGTKLECPPIPLSVLASCCPTLTVTALQPGPCVNGKRSVVVNASVSGVLPGTVLQWVVPNSTMPTTTAFVVSANGSLPAKMVEYLAAAASMPQTITLMVISPTGCPSTSATVTIDPCPSCCPTVTIASPTLTGCAPATAVASFTAALSWPAGCTVLSASSYEWTLNGPGNKKYQLSTASATASTSIPWIETATSAPAAVQFTVGGAYSVSVTADIPGVMTPPCLPVTDTRPFIVSACCPTLVGPLNGSAKPGDPCTWFFSAQVANAAGAPVSFDWAFQDGTTATTGVPQIEHTYPKGGITSGITTVTLKSPNCPDQDLSMTVTVMCFCPALAGTLTGSARSGDPCTWDFTASVTNPGGVPVSFVWTFQDGTTTTTTTPTVAHTYPAGTTGTGTTSVTLKTSGCSDQTASMSVTPACPGGSGGGGGGGGGLGCLCTLLLIIVFALLAIASVATVVACCATAPQVVLIAIIVAIVAWILAMVLFVIWVVVCGRAPGACGVLNTIECVVDWIMVVVIPVVALILSAGLWNWCGVIAALLMEGEWGLFLLAITEAQKALGCPRTRSCFVPKPGP